MLFVQSLDCGVRGLAVVGPVVLVNKQEHEIVNRIVMMLQAINLQNQRTATLWTVQVIDDSDDQKPN